MMIPDEKLEHYGDCYRTLTRMLERIGPVKIPTFYRYLQFHLGEFNMRDFSINRHPLPLMARLRRTVRRWFAKGKQHG